MAPNPHSARQSAKRLPSLTGGPEPVQSAPEPQETWDTSFTQTAWVGEDYEAQVFQRERREEQTGQLVQFAVGLQVRKADTDDAWVDVVRVDVAHGFVHVDRYTQWGHQHKDVDCVPSHCRNDLDASLKWAVDYVWAVEERMGEWA